MKSSEPSTKVAKTGAASTATAGTFDLDVDSNGRWSVERFKGLLFNIESDANVIAQDTRRGKGNFIICSSDVASALSMAGVLDYAPALNTSLNVDDTINTFVLVFLMVGIVYTLILILQTLVLQVSSTLQVTRAHHLTMLVCSIAHTFLCKWFVRLTRLLSNLRLDSRLVTV